jgi:hypothetical protein
MTDPPDPDLGALTRAIAIDRAESTDHARQIDALLKSEPWQDVGKFCAYRCQVRALNLQPGQIPPCLADLPPSEVATILHRFADYAARFN